MSAGLADELEPICARAWPAEEVETLGAWRLHASRGFSGRINSCWPLGSPGMALPAAVARVEDWYHLAGLPPVFKIVDGAAGSLCERLDRLGYRPDTATLLMVGDTGGPGDPAVSVSRELGGAFAGVFRASGDTPEDTAERLSALARAPAPTVYAVARGADGTPAAIGACAIEGAWSGVFAMRTAAGHRRAGLATRVLRTLLAQAREAGAGRCWLQVEEDNGPAVALYLGHGFASAYRYRYWRRPDMAKDGS